MSNRFTKGSRGRRKLHARQGTPHRPRTTALELSNPFLRKERKAAFDETVVAVGRMFPHASVDWVRRHAWAKARTVAVPARKRRARG